MEIRELLACLDQHRGSFPERLVAEAVARREEVIPALLETLEAIDSNPAPWLADQGRMVHIHAMYLVALFRETRAYPLLVRIFSRPGEFPFDLAGDVVTEDLGRILASVSGGDISGMAALIENEQANEYVRSAALHGTGIRWWPPTSVPVTTSSPTFSSYSKSWSVTRERTGTAWPTSAPTSGRKKRSRNSGAPTETASWTPPASIGRTLRML